MCPRKETMNLNFVENLVSLRVYPRRQSDENFDEILSANKISLNVEIED